MPLLFGLLSVALWGAVIYFGWQWVNQNKRKYYEDELQFEVDAAPWSDHHLESLLARHPGSPAVLTQYVAIAVQRQAWPEALRRAELFAARAPRAARAWLTQVEALRHLGRWDDALALLGQAVRRLPHDPIILAAWASEAFDRKDWAEAVHRFAAVRRWGPTRVEGYCMAADALVEDGRGDAAEALVAEGLRRLPDEWRLWQAAARVAERLDRQDEAIARWEAVRARFPGEPSGYVGGSQALERAGRTEEAASMIREASDFLPGNAEIAAVAARMVPPG